MTAKSVWKDTMELVVFLAPIAIMVSVLTGKWEMEHVHVIPALQRLPIAQIVQMDSTEKIV